MSSYTSTASSSSGFLSTSVWQSLDDKYSFCRLVQYRSIEEWQTVYDTMVKSGFLADAVQRYDVVPDIEMYRPVWTKSCDLSKVQTGQILSLSVRTTDPGYAQEWVDELKDIFESISLIPGFMGAEVAQNHIVAEEVLGLAHWATKPAFEGSIPMHGSGYPIRAYQAYR